MSLNCFSTLSYMHCCLLTRQLRMRRGLPSLSSDIPLSSVKDTSCPSCKLKSCLQKHA